LRKMPRECMPSVYRNCENAIAGVSFKKIVRQFEWACGDQR
jgi:hypothetical protein